jgi:hypothetical protein
MLKVTWSESQLPSPATTSQALEPARNSPAPGKPRGAGAVFAVSQAGFRDALNTGQVNCRIPVRSFVPAWPGIGQGPTTPWITYQDAAGHVIYGGRPLGPPPVSMPFGPRRGCPAATGRVSGNTLGLVKLGMTRARARRAYTHSSDRGKRYEDFFCLTPIGVRVGYGSPTLLKTLRAGERKRFKGRVVWASTSNPFYAIRGLRPGATLAVARKHLKLTGPFHVGLNFWYLGTHGRSTAVLKVRRRIVEEIGIADKSLTKSHKAQRKFLRSFS